MARPKRKSGDWDNDAADTKDETEETQPAKEKNDDESDELALLDDSDELETDGEEDEEL